MKAATISLCGQYRYTLHRRIEDGDRNLLFIMLNPSTADAELDDPTIRKCMGFASQWDYSTLTVVNLFAYRSTKPEALRKVDHPIGPDNDSTILYAANLADMVICAWGNHGTFGRRDEKVKHLLQHKKLYALDITSARQPKHPLYVPYGIEPVLYKEAGK